MKHEKNRTLIHNHYRIVSLNLLLETLNALRLNMTVEITSGRIGTCNFIGYNESLN